MFARCANPSCAGWYSSDEGKLFCLDLEIANTAGATQHEVVFLWLCGSCASWLNPKVEVAGNTIRVLLAAAPPSPSKPAAIATVN